MQFQYRRLKKSLLASSIAATLCAAPALTYSASVLEEVVVTARKRQESLQETPIAISAMSGDQLAAQGINSTADLRASVPNIDVYSGNGTTGAGNIFIRGVGARNTGVNYDSGVGIYLDGVYLSRADGAVMDNVDIASLQVLRGPQGTLFGKNTTGGAILYSTNKPTDRFEGTADLRAGNYGRLDGKITVNTPLVADLLNARFSLFSTRRDGTVENVTLHEKLSDEDRMGAQAHFLLLIDNDIQVDFNNFYSKTDQKARGQKCQFVQGSPGAGWQAGLQDVPIVIPSQGKSIADLCRDNENLSIDKVTSDLVHNNYFAENYQSAITVDWDIRDDLSFKSVTAYRGTRSAEANDLDATANPLLTRTNFTSGGSKRSTDQWSQEFQFTGNAFDEKLDYVAGVFGFSEKSGGGAYAGITGPYFGTSGVDQIAYYTNQRTSLEADNWSGSIFTQADWKFDEAWTLTAGLRYTKESRKLTRVIDQVDPSTLAKNGSPPAQGPFPDPETGNSSDTYYWPDGPGSFNTSPGYMHVVTASTSGLIADINNQTAKSDKSAWTPMVSLQRSFEDVGFIETGSAYVTMAKGFLSGGLSEAIDPNTQLMPEYKPEKVINYELGFKFDALDRRIRVNTAVFYLDYTDRQLTSVTINPEIGQISAIPINAKKSSIKGIEIESEFIPIDNLQLTANLTFNHGEISKFDDHRIVETGSNPQLSCQRIGINGSTMKTVDYCAVDRSGEDLPRLPTQIYFAAAQYTFNTELGSLTPRIQFSFRKDVDNCFDVSSCDSGIYKVNQRDISARLTWASPDKSWSLSAYGNNLSDQRYIIGGTPLVDVTQTAGVVYSDPRMYGIETHYSW